MPFSIYQLEYLKHLTTPSDKNNSNLFIAGGNTKWCSHFKKQIFECDWKEDGGVGGSGLPSSYTHTKVTTPCIATNSENDPRTGRTGLPQLILDRRPHRKRKEWWRQGWEPPPHPKQLTKTGGTSQARRCESIRLRSGQDGVPMISGMKTSGA